MKIFKRSQVVSARCFILSLAALLCLSVGAAQSAVKTKKFEAGEFTLAIPAQMKLEDTVDRGIEENKMKIYIFLHNQGKPTGSTMLINRVTVEDKSTDIKRGQYQMITGAIDGLHKQLGLPFDQKQMIRTFKSIKQARINGRDIKFNDFTHDKMTMRVMTFDQDAVVYMMQHVSWGMPDSESVALKQQVMQNFAELVVKAA